LVIAIAIQRIDRGSATDSCQLNWWIGGAWAGGDLALRLGRGEAAAPVRSLAHGIWSFLIRGCSKTMPGALNALFESELLRVIEFLLTVLSLAEKLEGALVLLVFDVVEAIAQQVPDVSVDRHAVEGRWCGVSRCAGACLCRCHLAGVA
jgi:hypothetical protein